MRASTATLRIGVSLLATVLALIIAFVPGVARAEDPPFGLSSFTVSDASTQAGAHSDITSTFDFNTRENGEPVGQLKDLQVTLPPGEVANSLAVPMCTSVEFQVFSCKPSAEVGLLTLRFYIGGSETEPVGIPVYNLTPIPGHVSTLGSSLLFIKFLIEGNLSQDGSYRLMASLKDLSTLIPIASTSLTLWGVPASPAHDLERWRTEIGGPQPIYSPPNEYGEREIIGIEPTPAGVSETPFLTNATDCEATGLTSAVSVDSWQGLSVNQTASVPAPGGCDQLHIAPKVSVTPETTRRDTPSGYDIDLAYPLDEAVTQFGTPNLRDATVTLPEGTSLSPGVASGLEGCEEAQFAVGACPEASKVGAATLTTPLLANRLTGAIYLSKPTPTAMYRIFVSVVAEGVTIHLTGVVSPDPTSGRISVAFSENPQLPFSDLDLHLFGGAGAAFANPMTCGPASTSSQLSSYAGQTVDVSSMFNVDADGAGGACPSAAPFAPRFSAGTMSPLAGGSSPFVLNVAREDGEQELATITAQLPAGLLGMLSTVPLCQEPQAASGSCAQASQIGSVTIGAGAGTQPLELAGKVYLTGPYKGAQFGLAIVVPAVAGPFDLGVIVLRTQVMVVPGDLHLKIVSDPLPRILGGIPLRLRTISLSIDRSGFMLSPTDCAAEAVSGTVGSAEGAQAAVSNPFQMVGCSGLTFTPKLTASTQAKSSSRGNGASLEVGVTRPEGRGANVSSVIVDLPKELRPRLTTIQQACLAATFATNPGACPAASVVGRATVHTPILATALSGPVYLVFYRGTTYPALVTILQADGISLELRGALNVSKAGVISSAFRSLPDVPMSSFILSLPRGPHSVLGSTKRLCGQALDMPYEIIGQNGTLVRRTVNVAVSGCPGHRAAKAAAGKRAAKAGTGKRQPRKKR